MIVGASAEPLHHAEARAFLELQVEDDHVGLFSRAAATARTRPPVPTTSTPRAWPAIHAVAQRARGSPQPQYRSGSQLVLLDQAVTKGVRSDVGVGLEVHLLEHAAAIGAHGLDAEAQFARDLRDRPRSPACRRSGTRVSRAAGGSAGRCRRCRSRRSGAPTSSGSDNVAPRVSRARLDEVFRRAFLAEEAVRARSQHVDRVLALRETGQDQHPRVGISRRT